MKMINRIEFIKMVASGNDFIVIDQQRGSPIQRLSSFARQICNRKYGVGADGLLILEKSRIANVKMRIFNPDGSEPDMCGNGIRCVALYAAQKQINIQTKAGIIRVNLNRDKAKLKISQPKDIKLDLPIKINRCPVRLNLINTGVPHAVIFVEGLDKIDVVNIGRQIRFHKRFLPEGVNVDFVQILDDNNITIRTYERGVEDETLACGTGVVASALLLVTRYSLLATGGINVHTRSGEILSVEFNRINGRFKDVWLEGKAKMVYKGVYNI